MVVTAWLLAMGVAPEQIDRAIEKTALLGPVKTLDKVGWDIVGSVAESLRVSLDENVRDRMSLPPANVNVFDILTACRNLGEKSGLGVYVWKKGRVVKHPRTRKPLVNPELQEAFPGLGQNQAWTDDAIRTLLFGAVINEAVRVLEQQRVKPEDMYLIDLAFVFATGLMANEGGPLEALNRMGAKTFCDWTTTIAAAAGGPTAMQPWRALFVPCRLLKEHAHARTKLGA